MSNKIVYGSMDDLRCELEHAQQDCVFLYKKNQDLERQLEKAREKEASLIKWLDQERQDWGSSEKDSWNPYHRVLSKLKEQG